MAEATSKVPASLRVTWRGEEIWVRGRQMARSVAAAAATEMEAEKGVVVVGMVAAQHRARGSVIG